MNHAQFWGGGGAAPHEIEQSLRFDGSSRLTRTHSCSQTRTFSFWNKYAFDNSNRYLYFHGDGSNYIGTRSGGSPNFNSWQTLNQGSSFTQIYRSDVKFRDPAAWYHFVFKCTSSNVILYINGEEWGSSGGANVALSSKLFEIGSRGNAEFFTGYQAEWHFADGQALDPTDFGEYDDNGVWRPIRYTGTYGTNGFYLKFDPSATNGIGHDHSGNGNNFTPSGFTTSGTGTDVMSDTPTTNWATLNPLSPSQSQAALSNGNIDCTWSGVSGHSRRSTIAMGSGKWYAEITRGTSTLSVGLVDADIKLLSWPGNSTYGSTGSYAYRTDNGNKYNNGNASSYGNTIATGDVIGIAYDGDNGALYFSKNGTWQNSGDPTSGASATGAAFTGLGNQTWTIACGNAGGSTGGTATNFNFGQRAFSYTPPSGYSALNTANLPAPDIADGSEYFNTVLYTGDGTSSRAITGMGFQADFLWLKPRSARNHSLVDVLRGTNHLQSNNTNAEASVPSFDSFDSDGFTVTADGSTNPNWNESPEPNVVWGWLAGGSGSSNTDGSITSTVSANQTAGFSIVSYTGTGANATVGHGLGVAPQFFFGRNRNDTSGLLDWIVYHESVGNTGRLKLNTTGSTSTSSTFFQNTSPSSTVISIGTSNDINKLNGTYIMYCFAEVEGYSKFGSYTGNGSTDGPFVYCGFKPAWVLVKCSSTTGQDWILIDSARSDFNICNEALRPNTADIELTNDRTDFLSNGFKTRNTFGNQNTSGQTYIFAAFASSPFGGSGVSPATAR